MALVTGAASGRGNAIANRLASDGAELIVGDITEAVRHGLFHINAVAALPTNLLLSPQLTSMDKEKTER